MPGVYFGTPSGNDRFLCTWSKSRSKSWFRCRGTQCPVLYDRGRWVLVGFWKQWSISSWISSLMFLNRSHLTTHLEKLLKQLCIITYIMQAEQTYPSYKKGVTRVPQYASARFLFNPQLPTSADNNSVPITPNPNSPSFTKLDRSPPHHSQTDHTYSSSFPWSRTHRYQPSSPSSTGRSHARPQHSPVHHNRILTHTRIL